MYECITDSARRVMQLANQEAIRFKHEFIGTEHILLGLVVEDAGIATYVLTELNVDEHNVRAEVEKIGADAIETTSHKLPPTPRAKKLIEYAIDAARSLDHDYIGSEHMLLGLLRDHESGEFLESVDVEGRHRGVADAGQFDQHRLDLAQLDAEAANLDLPVDAAEKLDLAIGARPHEVVGAIEPR